MPGTGRSVRGSIRGPRSVGQATLADWSDPGLVRRPAARRCSGDWSAATSGTGRRTGPVPQWRCWRPNRPCRDAVEEWSVAMSGTGRRRIGGPIYNWSVHPRHTLADGRTQRRGPVGGPVGGDVRGNWSAARRGLVEDGSVPAGGTLRPGGNRPPGTGRRTGRWRCRRARPAARTGGGPVLARSNRAGRATLMTSLTRTRPGRDWSVAMWGLEPVGGDVGVTGRSTRGATLATGRRRCRTGGDWSVAMSGTGRRHVGGLANRSVHPWVANGDRSGRRCRGPVEWSVRCQGLVCATADWSEDWSVR
jgi:hypothetical protein